MKQLVSKQKQSKMYDKIKLASTLDSLMFEFNSLFLELTRIIQTLENDSVDLKEKHEQELKKAYDLGYNDAVLIERQQKKVR